LPCALVNIVLKLPELLIRHINAGRFLPQVYHPNWGKRLLWIGDEIEKHSS
jgi:hypothetical protein